MVAEKVKTLDLQLYHRGEKHYTALSAFYTQQDKLIAPTEFEIDVDPITFALKVNPGQYLNQGESQFYGLEWEGKWELQSQWHVNASLSWQENRDQDDNRDRQLSPQWMAKMGAQYRPKEGLSIGLFNSYIDAFQDISELLPDAETLNPAPESYNLLTLNIQLKPAEYFNHSGFKNVQLSLYGSNLLDENIVHATAFGIGSNNALPAHAGRAWYGTLTLQW
ncbi:MAG: TonB-dependent receptor [Pseudomonadales bacterium]|nr:TonB-dependent receptor [Pseudomonadales bacterium]